MPDLTPPVRTFTLIRDTDVSGISGTGEVAHGVLWPDGTVTIRWTGERPSTVNWSNLEDPEAIHGHGGATRFQWHDGIEVDRDFLVRVDSYTSLIAHRYMSGVPMDVRDELAKLSGEARAKYEVPS